MSTRCNIVVRNEQDLRREIVLYQHNDGSPEDMIPKLTKMMDQIHDIFSKSGDQGWFFEPTKVAGMIVHLSVPVITSEVSAALRSAPKEVKEFVTKHILKPIPQITPESGRFGGCDYEYLITLKEEFIDNKRYHCYDLEAIRIGNGKRLF